MHLLGTKFRIHSQGTPNKRTIANISRREGFGIPLTRLTRHMGVIIQDLDF